MTSPCTTRAGIAFAALTLWAATGACAQNSSGQSLGDVARETRKEHASASHVVARQNTNEEEDGPDPGGVWRVQLCAQMPCYEIAITLPKSPKWTRLKDEPRPVLIPVPGYEQDPSHAIRVYAAGALPRSFYPDAGTRTFLQSWFTRPEYFGQAARIVFKRSVIIDGRGATIANFTLASGLLRYRGLSVIAGTSYGDFGFACVFREEDAAAAASVCDGIVDSTRTQTVQPATQRWYPSYPSYPYRPVLDPREDDPPDPPDSDDPDQL